MSAACLQKHCLRRPVAPAVCAMTAVPAGGGRSLLAAAHADGTLRLWSPARRACVLAEAARPGAAAAEGNAPSRLRYAPPPHGGVGRPGKLVAQYDAPTTAPGRHIERLSFPITSVQCRVCRASCEVQAVVHLWVLQPSLLAAACGRHSDAEVTASQQH